MRGSSSLRRSNDKDPTAWVIRASGEHHITRFDNRKRTMNGGIAGRADVLLILRFGFGDRLLGHGHDVHTEQQKKHAVPCQTIAGGYIRKGREKTGSADPGGISNEQDE